MTRNNCHILTFVGLCLICHELAVVSGHVLVYRRSTNQLIEELNDLPAQFGANLPPNGLKVFVVPAEPSSFACDKLIKPPRTIYPVNAKFVSLISRGGACTFEKKVRVAQSAGYFAVIVYNNEGDDLEQMSADNSTGIYIPAVFVGHTSGKFLSSLVSTDIVVIINDELPFNINTQLILPFSILIGLCFLIMVVYMIYKCIREQRRQRRHRLPKSMLKKLPVFRYTKNNGNNKYDTCVICLEEFVEDDKLRVLPCTHPYHTHCIDPWLTENRRVCPMCKRKVFTKGEARANRNRQLSLDSVTDTDDDTTPLLQQQPTNSRQRTAAGGPAGSSTSVTAATAAGTTRHGTFSRVDGGSGGSASRAGTNPFETEENQSSDEENALLVNTPLANSSSSSTRVNPFDRAPNLPAHLAVQLNENRPSMWSRIGFGFLFRQPPTNVSVAAPPFLDHVESGLPTTTTTTTSPTVAVSMSPASNNILNPNLSGSFKDDDDMPPHRSIYEPIAPNTPSSPNVETAGDETTGDSIFLQTATQGGIGVAALPHSGSSDRLFHI